jgi:hypothetical protein
MRPRRPAHRHKDAPERVFSSNPFDFRQLRTLCTQWRFATPFPSITSALFSVQWRGECISCPCARHSSLALRHCKSCVCHTSEKTLLTPLFATHPKAGSRKFLVCHTYDTPGSLCTSQTKASRVACLRPPVRHSSYCVHYPAVPQLARNDGSAGKQSRFFRCLMKESGQRVRQGSSPRPAGGRSLRGCRETRDKSAPYTWGVAGRKGRQCPIGLVP